MNEHRHVDILDEANSVQSTNKNDDLENNLNDDLEEKGIYDNDNPEDDEDENIDEDEETETKQIRLSLKRVGSTAEKGEEIIHVNKDGTQTIYINGNEFTVTKTIKTRKRRGKKKARESKNKEVFSDEPCEVKELTKDDLTESGISGRLMNGISTKVDFVLISGVYKCTLCHKTYNTRGGMAAHQCSICKGCLKLFSTAQKLRFHNCKLLFTCPKCQEKCLKAEIDKHECHLCSICCQKFASAVELRDHTCEKHFTCPACMKNCASSEGIEKHECNICQLCLRKFSSKLNLKKHNCQKLKVFPCKDCKKMFQTIHNFETHKCTYCVQCSHIFSTNQKFRNHRCYRQVTSNKSEETTCNNCRKTFASRQYYATHKCTFCVKCSFRFSSYQKLSDHRCDHIEGNSRSCLSDDFSSSKQSRITADQNLIYDNDCDIGVALFKKRSPPRETLIDNSLKKICLKETFENPVDMTEKLNVFACPMSECHFVTDDRIKFVIHMKSFHLHDDRQLYDEQPHSSNNMGPMALQNPYTTFPQHVPQVTTSSQAMNPTSFQQILHPSALQPRFMEFKHSIFYQDDFDLDRR